MCKICRQQPCASRCPNASEPKRIYTCDLCGNDIVEGEEYMEFNDKCYHFEDCAKEVALHLLTTECGATVEIAEVNNGANY